MRNRDWVSFEMTKRGNLRNILSAVEELSSEGNEWRKGDK